MAGGFSNEVEFTSVCKLGILKQSIIPVTYPSEDSIVSGFSAGNLVRLEILVMNLLDVSQGSIWNSGAH